MAEDIYFTDEEAANHLRLSVWTLRQWRCKGKGPKFLKIGRRVLYQKTDVLDFVKSNVYDNTSQYPKTTVSQKRLSTDEDDKQI